MGGHAWECSACGHRHFQYNSCRNRHCPACGGGERARWLERMLAWRLPIPYLHVVFTLPHELTALILANPYALFALLFRAAWRALSQLAARLGAKLGAVMVLHTWGSRMNLHVHIHCLVTVGGPSLDGSRWLEAPEGLLSAEELAPRFRHHYLEGLKRLHRRGKLQFCDSKISASSRTGLSCCARSLGWSLPRGRLLTARAREPP